MDTKIYSILLKHIAIRPEIIAMRTDYAESVSSYGEEAVFYVWIVYIDTDIHLATFFQYRHRVICSVSPRESKQ